jgi:hypothetical protein
MLANFFVDVAQAQLAEALDQVSIALAITAGREERVAVTLML